MEVKGTSPGTYYLIAEVEGDNAVPEFKENNQKGSRRGPLLALDTRSKIH